PHALLGRSAHSAAEVVAAAPEADYVQLGPIFETPSKRRFGPPLGLDLLGRVARDLRAAASPPALVAIGGIDRQRLTQAAAAGADAAAVIGAVWNAADVRAAAAELVQMARSSW